MKRRNVVTRSIYFCFTFLLVFNLLQFTWKVNIKTMYMSKCILRRVICLHWNDKLTSSVHWYFRLAASVLWCWSWEKEGKSSWSGPWHLGCTLEVFHVHSYQDQFIQPGWAECVFCAFGLGLCFVCSFVLFYLFVCPHSFMFPWAVESFPLQFLVLA